MPQPQILKVEALPDYQICVTYRSGESGVFDVSPYIEGSWYGLLRDRSYFATVHVANNGQSVEWAGGQDIAPHELFDLMVRKPASKQA
jgi:hypothetical protein